VLNGQTLGASQIGCNMPPGADATVYCNMMQRLMSDVRYACVNRGLENAFNSGEDAAHAAADVGAGARADARADARTPAPSVNVFLCFFRIFKYTTINPRLNQLIYVISTAFSNIVYFCLIFMILTIGFR